MTHKLERVCSGNNRFPSGGLFRISTACRPMKLGLIQMYVAPGQAAENLARAAEWVRRAAAEGAEVVLLPEALPCGWMHPGGAEEAGAIPGGEHYRQIAALAERHGIYVCAGLVEKRGEAIFNAAVLINPSGELLLHHRKIHELGIAHGCYALGDRLAVAHTEHGVIGLMICADGFAPGQVIARSLALMGAQLVLSPCAWAVPPEHDNEREPYGRLWIDNYGTVARECGLWIAGCSNVGPIAMGPWAGHNCIGNSLVIDGAGEVARQGRYGVRAEELMIVEVKVRRRIRVSAE
jgi:predicted amidohydrolase